MDEKKLATIIMDIISYDDIDNDEKIDRIENEIKNYFTEKNGN